MTVVCVLGFLQCAITAIVYLVASQFVDVSGLAFLIVLAVIGAQMTCLIGLWRMRLWALPAYFALMTVLHLIEAGQGSVPLLSLLLAIATVGVGIANIHDLE